MYVKQKDFNTGTLYDVTIYDHRDGYENLSVIVSDSALMETTADKQHLYLHLFSGEQFCQEKPELTLRLRPALNNVIEEDFRVLSRHPLHMTVSGNTGVKALFEECNAFR